MEMNLRSTVKKIGYALKKAGNAMIARTQEALSPALFGLIAGDQEDAKFRRISSPATLRDLNPVMHERMQQVSFYMKATNPVARRLVQLTTNYVVGEGFEIVCKDAQVQEWIDRFWNDDINQMDETVRSWSDELATMGELPVPVAVNEVNGFVRIGWLDPINVAAVEYGQISTLEGTQVVAVPFALHIKKLLNQADSAQVRLTVVRRDEDPKSETYGFLNGECFFLAINKAKSATRGISDIFAIADQVDCFDQMLFDFGDRIRMLNAFVWHVKLNGADKKTVEETMKAWTKDPPRQGGVKVTNEQVTIEAQTPKFQGADMSQVVTELKKYIVGTAGFSPMFFGDPVDSNKSTANEMEGPTGKMLTDRQNQLKEFVGRIVTFVIDQGILHGSLPETVDRSFQIQVPDLLVKDMATIATTLPPMAQSLQLAQEQGWIRGETAARSFHVLLSQIGVEVDSKEEYELAQQELQDKKAQGQNDLNDQANLAAALSKAKQLAGDQPGMVQ